MHEGHRHRALADRRGKAFDGAVPHVAGGEHAWNVGFQVIQEPGVERETAGEKGLLLLRSFVVDVERVLKRRGRLAEVEAELRERVATPAA